MLNRKRQFSEQSYEFFLFSQMLNRLSDSFVTIRNPCLHIMKAGAKLTILFNLRFYSTVTFYSRAKLHKNPSRNYVVNLNRSSLQPSDPLENR